jgi:hypothetical protein
VFEILVEDKSSDSVLCAGLAVCFPSTRFLSFQRKAKSVTTKRETKEGLVTAILLASRRTQLHSNFGEKKEFFLMPLKKEILKTVQRQKRVQGSHTALPVVTLCSSSDRKVFCR